MLTTTGRESNVDWFGLYCRFLNPKLGSLIAEPTDLNALCKSQWQADEIGMAQGRQCFFLE